MKEKIYKYGFLGFCGVLVCLILYLALYGAIERSHAFANWLDTQSITKQECVSQCALLRAVDETKMMKGLK